jgi:DNA-directed RNA polymerase specialized sigma24 family protein
VSGTNKHWERDQLIKRLLLSRDSKDQIEGMRQLHVVFRDLVANVVVMLTGSALLLESEAHADNGSRRIDEERFGDIWQETLTCVLQRVQAGTFRANGSLLAYLVTIAMRRMADDWRKRQWLEDYGRLDSFGCEPRYWPTGLIEDIERFCKGMAAKNRMTLVFGVALSCLNGSGRGIMPDLFNLLFAIRHEIDWERVTREGVETRYKRLRKALRKNLRKRGYDV